MAPEARAAKHDAAAVEHHTGTLSVAAAEDVAGEWGGVRKNEVDGKDDRDPVSIIIVAGDEDGGGKDRCTATSSSGGQDRHADTGRGRHDPAGVDVRGDAAMDAHAGERGDAAGDNRADKRGATVKDARDGNHVGSAKTVAVVTEGDDGGDEDRRAGADSKAGDGG